MPRAQRTDTHPLRSPEALQQAVQLTEGSPDAGPTPVKGQLLEGGGALRIVIERNVVNAGLLVYARLQREAGLAYLFYHSPHGSGLI